MDEVVKSYLFRLALTHSGTHALGHSRAPQAPQTNK